MLYTYSNFVFMSQFVGVICRSKMGIWSVIEGVYLGLTVAYSDARGNVTFELT